MRGNNIKGAIMLKLATIFTDHMVLQANKPIKIFGEGEGNGKIEFLGNTYTTYGTGDTWCVTIPEMPYGGPYEMTFESEGEKTTITDIYVGEVWFASGQSNMEMPLFRVDFGIEEAKHAENNLIRFFRVPKQFKRGLAIHGTHFVQTYDIDRPWLLCNEENALLTSALGYAVVKELQAKLGCAVGLIECHWGARKIEPFIDKKYFYDYDFLRPQIEEYNQMLANLDKAEYEKKIQEHVKAREEQMQYHKDALQMVKDRGVRAAVWVPEFDVKIPELPKGPYSLDNPGTLYDSMVSKVVPYGMQGILWYQGESNDTKDYAKKCLVFMKCFREAFENKDLSFYAIELAPFDYNGRDDEFVTEPNNWGFRREQQMIASRVDEKIHLVTCQHLGDRYDIHPLRKLELGHRMALKVLKHSYKFDIEADQPTYKCATFSQNNVEVEFDNARGLYSQYWWAVRFLVADENNQTELVQPEYKDNKVILNCKMAEPKKVRFAFQSYYNGMVPFNEAGLPISPFRSDGYEELLAEVKEFYEKELN